MDWNEDFWLKIPFGLFKVIQNNYFYRRRNNDYMPTTDFWRNLVESVLRSNILILTNKQHYNK